MAAVACGADACYGLRHNVALGEERRVCFLPPSGHRQPAARSLGGEPTLVVGRAIQLSKCWLLAVDGLPEHVIAEPRMAVAAAAAGRAANCVVQLLRQGRRERHEIGNRLGCRNRLSLGNGRNASG